MEIIILGLIGLFVIIYFGFDSSLEAGARMANRRVERLEANQISDDVKYYNANQIDDEKFATAVQQKELIKTYRNM
ncbi:MAG: hypothetical protein ACYDD5_00550 [Sulfuricurvum sp.]